jgi:hypothetical protein
MNLCVCQEINAPSKNSIGWTGKVKVKQHKDDVKQPCKLLCMNINVILSFPNITSQFIPY